MSPDRRNAQKLGPFTTWQWAVLGAYIVALALSIVVWIYAHRVETGAKHGRTAICVEIGFLRNSLDVSRKLVNTGSAAERAARREGLVRLNELIARLRTEIPDCQL